MICLICEKQVNMLNEYNLDGAGEIIVSFGYGSNHDQIGVPDLTPQKRMDVLLSSDTIKSVICDSCFEKKEHCFNGYNVRTTLSEKLIV